ncbi:unnamed protein product [Sphagnum balticum]
MNKFGISTPQWNASLGNIQQMQSLIGAAARSAIHEAGGRSNTELGVITRSLPGADMTPAGLYLSSAPLMGANDFDLAKQQAKEKWWNEHNRSLEGFESDFNNKISPGVFTLYRLQQSPYGTAAVKALLDNMQQTAQGKATLAHLKQQMQFGMENGYFEGVDPSAFRSSGNTLDRASKGKFNPNDVGNAVGNATANSNTANDNSNNSNPTLNNANTVPSGDDTSANETSVAQRQAVARVNQGTDSTGNFDLMAALDQAKSGNFVNDESHKVDKDGTLKDDSWMNVLGAVPSGLYAGVSGIANLPGNLYNAGVSTLTGLGGNQPVPGAANPTLQPVPDVVNTNPTGYTPNSPLARDVYSGAQNVGAALSTPIVGGVVGAVGRGLAGGTTADTVSAVGKGLQDVPLNARTIGGAATGGVVGQQAEDASPDWAKPVANLAGQVVGDTAFNSLVAGGGQLANKVGLGKEKITTPDGVVIPVTPRQQDKAAAELYQGVGGEQGKNDLANSVNTQSDIPGYKRDTAQSLASSDADTSGLNVVGAAAALHDNAALISRNQANQEALAADVRSSAPQVPPGFEHELSQETLAPFLQQQDEADKAFNKQLDDVALEVQKNKLNPPIDPNTGVAVTNEDAGAALRDRIAQIEDANTRSIGMRMNQFDPQGRYSASSQRLVPFGQSALASDGQMGITLGSKEKALYQSIADLPPIVPMKTVYDRNGNPIQIGLDTLLSNTSAAQLELAQAGLTNTGLQGTRLVNLKNAIRATIENADQDRASLPTRDSSGRFIPLIRPPAPGEVQANAADRADYARTMETFGQPGVAPLLNKGGERGDYTLLDSDVLHSFLNGQRTQPQLTQHVIDAARDDPTGFVPTQIANGLVQQMRDKGIIAADGTLNAQKARDWFNSTPTQETLNIPELVPIKQRINNAIQSQEAFDAEVARQDVERERFSKAIAGQFLGDPDNPDKVFDNLMRDTVKGPRNLVEFVQALRGNPAGISGAQQLLADHLVRKLMTPDVVADDALGAQTTRPGVVKQKQFNEYINKYRQGIKNLMSGTGWQSIDRVGREITRTQDAATRTALGNSATAERLMANRLNKMKPQKHSDTVYALIADRFGENLADLARERMGREGESGPGQALMHLLGGPVLAGATLFGSTLIKSMHAANIKNANDLRVAMFLHPEIANLLLQRVGPDGKITGLWQKKFAAALRNQVIVNSMADLTKDYRGQKRGTALQNGMQQGSGAATTQAPNQQGSFLEPSLSPQGQKHYAGLMDKYQNSPATPLVMGMTTGPIGELGVGAKLLPPSIVNMVKGVIQRGEHKFGNWSDNLIDHVDDIPDINFTKIIDKDAKIRSAYDKRVADAKVPPRLESEATLPRLPEVFKGVPDARDVLADIRQQQYESSLKIAKSNAVYNFILKYVFPTGYIALTVFLLSTTALCHAQTSPGFVGVNSNPQAPPLTANALNSAFQNKTDLNIIASGSTTARTAAARAADVINVKDYGALGTGGDDTIAIQTAANAVGTNGAILEIPYGSYFISSPITLASNTHVHCSGAVLNGSVTTPTSAFTNTSSTNIEVSGCRFIWPYGYGSVHILQWTGTTNVNVHDNISDGAGDFVADIGTISTTEHDNVVTNVSNACFDHWNGFNDASVVNNYCSTYASSGAGLGAIQFTGISTGGGAANSLGYSAIGNTIYMNNANSPQCIEINGYSGGGGTDDRGVIANNRCYVTGGNSSWGVLIQYANNGTVHDNVFYNNGGAYSAVNVNSGSTGWDVHDNRAVNWKAGAAGVFTNDGAAGSLHDNTADSSSSTPLLGTLGTDVISYGNDNGTGVLNLANISAATTATGSNIARLLSDREADVVYLNDYVTPTQSNTDGAVNGTAFTSASTTFSAANVGNYILVRGAGAAGISFQTTIAAYVSAHSVTLAAAAPTAVTRALFYYGADATAGVTQAFANAAATNAAVKGRGGFWLASQTTPISLSSVSVSNDGGPTAEATPYLSGLTFLVTGTVASPFNVGLGVTFSANVFYPAQDGSATTPLVYPAIFNTPSGTTTANFTLSGATLVNPYIMWTLQAGGSAGRIFVGNSTKAFCISRCFDLHNGTGDTIQTDNTVYFGPGVYDTATSGAHNLQTYGKNNTEIFHLDPGGPGSNYTSDDGIMINGGLWQSARYGIRLLSGLIDVSYVSGVIVDGTPTALSVEGNAECLLPWTGGEIYSINEFAPTDAYDTFYLGSSNAVSQLTISGVQFSYSQGNVIHATTTSFNQLTLTGNTFGAWGETSTTGGTYYAVNIGPIGIDSLVTITGNNFSPATPTASNTIDGIAINGGTVAVTGNTIRNTNAPITFTTGSGNSGNFTLKGNATDNTTGPLSFVNATVSPAHVVGDNSDNSFDKPSGPTLSGAGTSPPALPASANDNIGTVTEGTSATGFTLTFGTAFTVAPRCTVSSPSGILFSYSASSAALTVTHASANGDTFVYRCSA